MTNLTIDDDLPLSKIIDLIKGSDKVVTISIKGNVLDDSGDVVTLPELQQLGIKTGGDTKCISWLTKLRFPKLRSVAVEQYSSGSPTPDKDGCQGGFDEFLKLHPQITSVFVRSWEGIHRNWELPNAQAISYAGMLSDDPDVTTKVHHPALKELWVSAHAEPDQFENLIKNQPSIQKVMWWVLENTNVDPEEDLDCDPPEIEETRRRDIRQHLHKHGYTSQGKFITQKMRDWVPPGFLSTSVEASLGEMKYEVFERKTVKS